MVMVWGIPEPGHDSFQTANLLAGGGKITHSEKVALSVWCWIVWKFIPGCAATGGAGDLGMD